jgi:hypothetical protein
MRELARIMSVATMPDHMLNCRARLVSVGATSSLLGLVQLERSISSG